VRLYKLLSYAFMWVVPVVLVFAFFFDRQPNKVTLGFSGSVLILILYVIYIKRIAEAKARKEIAHETALNMERASTKKTIYQIAVLQTISYGVPLGVLAWMTYVITEYNGNMLWAVVCIIASVGISQVFMVLDALSDRIRLLELENTKQNAINDAVASKVADRLGQSNVS